VLQILINIALSYFGGAFRIFNRAHRGAMWGNVQRTVVLISTLVLVFLKVPIWVIALGQLVMLIPIALMPLIDIRRNAPEVFPTLKYWDSSLARTTFSSSMFFGLFTLNNFLLFQAPVLILNHFLGSTVVVTFTIGRTLFSFVRQSLTLIQSSIAPEITRLNGIGDNIRLFRLYQFSESIVLSGALILNVAVYLLSPALLWLWLKRPELFASEMYLLLMAVSALMSVKEYKLYFQYATNQHIKTSIMTFLTYLFMVIASLFAIGRFEVKGLLMVWLLTEFMQIGFLNGYNNELFAKRGEIPLSPVLKLIFILSIITLIAYFLYPLPDNVYTFSEMATVVAIILILSGISYFLFGFGKLIRERNLTGA
jgi:O-antigen/teichoic acid export membrane protein